MNYYIYILENPEGKHYIGYTNNLEDRLKRHNTNQVRWTSKKGPWNIIYKEIYETRQEAYRREKQIKSYKGGEAFKKLLWRGVRFRFQRNPAEGGGWFNRCVWLPPMAECRQRRQKRVNVI